VPFENSPVDRVEETLFGQPVGAGNVPQPGRGEIERRRKLIYLALRNITRDWKMPPREWKAASATGNWAYDAYLRDRGGKKSYTAVLAFMSANLAMIKTSSPMTWDIGLPMPHTADSFDFDGNQLHVIHPPYTSFEQYVNTFYNTSKWSDALNFFGKYDTMYNSFIMRANILDHSSLFRLIRRAYGQRFVRNARRAVLDEEGFRSDSEQVEIGQHIIHEFALQARSEGMIPVIFLVNNLGYSDYLFRALAPVLRSSPRTAGYFDGACIL
jgi:hypothetical protein